MVKNNFFPHEHRHTHDSTGVSGIDQEELRARGTLGSIELPQRTLSADHGWLAQEVCTGTWSGSLAALAVHTSEGRLAAGALVARTGSPSIAYPPLGRWEEGVGGNKMEMCIRTHFIVSLKKIVSKHYKKCDMIKLLCRFLTHTYIHIHVCTQGVSRINGLSSLFRFKACIQTSTIAEDVHK